LWFKASPGKQFERPYLKKKKKKITKKSAGGVAHGVGTEFKTQLGVGEKEKNSWPLVVHICNPSY
jgi:hypothetical protein